MLSLLVQQRWECRKVQAKIAMGTMRLAMRQVLHCFGG